MHCGKFWANFVQILFRVDTKTFFKSMNRFIHNAWLSFLLCTGTGFIYAQNVGIGTNSPNASAKLEVVDANRGFLFPRVSLSATNVAAPVTSPANWLVVFNIATAGTGATAVSPGLYYWDGSQWVRFQASNTNNWTILGNAGTNPNTNFIGTTDAMDFVLRTASTERMRITAGGNVGIGEQNPNVKLQVSNGDVRIGEITAASAAATFPNYGRALYFSGGASNGWDSDNSDPIYFRRINNGSDASELNLFLGDNAASTNNDKFTIGAVGPTYLERFSFFSNGRMGMGITNPNTLIATTAGSLVLGQGSPDYAELSGGAGFGANLALRWATNGNINTYISGNNHSYLNTQVGNVGIGTTAPSSKLVVSDASAETNIAIMNQNSGGSVNSTASISFHNNASNSWRNYMGGSSGYAGVGANAMEWWYYPSIVGATGCCHKRFVIQETGAGYVPVTIDGSGQMFGNGWAQPSDKNLKQNILRLENASQKISQMGGYTYQFTQASGLNDGKTHVGVLAQEVEKVLPEAIKQFPNMDFKAVDYDAIIPLLIEAHKEQQTTIEKLQKELQKMNALEQSQAELKAELEALKKLLKK